MNISLYYQKLKKHKITLNDLRELFKHFKIILKKSNWELGFSDDEINLLLPYFKKQSNQTKINSKWDYKTYDLFYHSSIASTICETHSQYFYEIISTTELLNVTSNHPQVTQYINDCISEMFDADWIWFANDYSEYEEWRIANPVEIMELVNDIIKDTIYLLKNNTFSKQEEKIIELVEICFCNERKE